LWAKITKKNVSKDTDPKAEKEVNCFFWGVSIMFWLVQKIRASIQKGLDMNQQIKQFFTLHCH